MITCEHLLTFFEGFLGYMKDQKCYEECINGLLLLTRWVIETCHT